MKAITNWRYYVMAVLFTVGALCVTLAFGDDELPMGEWLIAHLRLFGFGIASFFTLGRLTKHWEVRGEIPEFTNQCKSDE